MVATALARGGMFIGGTQAGKQSLVALKDAQYEVLKMWQQTYGQAMRVMLPDTFGSSQFFNGAPSWLAEWTGVRLDSKDPYIAGEEALRFFASHGQDPRQKLLIPSDGLDVNKILGLHAFFGGEIQEGFSPSDFRSAKDFMNVDAWRHTPRCRISMGVGTNLTNSFVGCSPKAGAEFKQISLVCKVDMVEGRPAVKLSDNYTKATGPASEVVFYRSEFGALGVENAPVFV
jgi:nicotinate phosphoribosyltransferase